MKDSLFKDLFTDGGERLCTGATTNLLMERLQLLENETNERLQYLEKKVFSPTEKINAVINFLGNQLPQMFGIWFMILGQASALIFASLGLIYLTVYFFGLIIK